MHDSTGRFSKNLELFFEDVECSVLEDSQIAFIFILNGNSFVGEHCNNLIYSRMD